MSPLLYVVFIIVFGSLFYILLKRQFLLKSQKAFIDYAYKKDTKAKINNAQEILEKSDPVLSYLSKMDKNVVSKILYGILVFIFFYVIDILFNLKISQSTLGIIGILAIIFFVLAPSYIAKYIVQSRVTKIGKDIPMFVDLLAICVQSGMSIEQAIVFLQGSIEQVNKAFLPFLNKLIAKTEVSGLEVALDELQKELPSQEISMLCATLKQSLKYGSGIYDSLMNLSAEIRESELLKVEEIIGKLAAKMSVPLILFFMFPVIIVIAAPGVMRVMNNF
ncbi:hypothetical protein BKH43_00240 [Helicobacter sp. 13S00401-1]|uniref:type II secretion system F family protein n=1 Tax=Helicobacter sp. 13S00401-1 TaxID=1905758 RepID=UPI000BA68F00|nr:type II secretion system F family protein [Helicobacter sp. 13S00401-1]PAF51706.1 hypothetical protein BKH43_00240 [Helicobacter sp. 13S00401-1]